jgi:hypothetical protein
MMKNQAKIIPLTLAILLIYGSSGMLSAATPDDDSALAGICLQAFQRCLDDPFVNVNFFGLLGCFGGLSFCFRFVEPLIR